MLDRVDQFDSFDPRHDYALALRQDELSDVERNACERVVKTLNDIELDIGQTDG